MTIYIQETAKTRIPYIETRKTTARKQTKKTHGNFLRHKNDNSMLHNTHTQRKKTNALLELFMLSRVAHADVNMSAVTTSKPPKENIGRTPIFCWA